MKHAVGLGCLTLFLLASACRADLQGDIKAVLADKELQKARVGIDIVRLGATDAQATEIYEHDSRQPMTPASNLKLATTSAALDRFGPDHKFRTTLLLHGNDLILIGDGDPSFGDSEYLKRVGWQSTTVFDDWAARLKKLNITSVRNVIVDDSVFDEEFMHPHWPIKQIDHWYVAEVGGLDFNINCLDFTITSTPPGGHVGFVTNPKTRYVNVENSCVGGRNEVQLGRKPGTNDVVLAGQASEAVPGPFQETIHDPPMYTGTVMAETLEAAGIKITGDVKRDRSAHQAQKIGGASWKVIGIHETPLAVVLARANKDSINLYAECLCKRLGHETTGSSGSWANGTAAVAAFLKKAGVPESEFHLDDGSGLSKQNGISPHALIRVLTYDFVGKNHDAFLNSLSVAGSDGTLASRFRGTNLRGRVIAKSGFVEGVSTLSGYLRTRDQQWYAFSIMMNGIPYKSSTLAKALQEKIVHSIDIHSSTATARR
ncbi:MAG TPA: D-alanyl-D-alanine carboxypeptidase/D-alanyl-D-alanine-endopeptidase [Tepidisphaeraceae bacterium]|nr:D-alanyl-D-alanine carboxypeptidase/D-alanyl-D-alanine-endopeptidase [Tepidisphaeraceae bacterium]